MSWVPATHRSPWFVAAMRELEAAERMSRLDIAGAHASPRAWRVEHTRREERLSRAWEARS